MTKYFKKNILKLRTSQPSARLEKASTIQALNCKIMLHWARLASRYLSIFYGASKRAVNSMFIGFEAADNLKRVIFRYFNFTGVDPEGVVSKFHKLKIT